MLKIAYKALDDKFANDIVVLDVKELSTMTDYFIIADGNNQSQVQAMAEEVQEKLNTECSIKALTVEGYSEASWILVHFGDVIVHLFNKENREFYRLEKVWGDARILSTDDLKLG